MSFNKYFIFIFIPKKEAYISYKGRFSPKNPKKYKGDVLQIYYRSLWELKFMKYCDTNSNIIEWSNEEVIIPYFSPLDQKNHRYFVDFYIKMVSNDGSIKEKLVEIKPYKQTMEPMKKEKISKKYLNEVQTWIINKNKWEAAQQYCKKKDWEFLILTEKQLFK